VCNFSVLEVFQILLTIGILLLYWSTQLRACSKKGGTKKGRSQNGLAKRTCFPMQARWFYFYVWNKGVEEDQEEDGWTA